MLKGRIQVRKVKGLRVVVVGAFFVFGFKLIVWVYSIGAVVEGGRGTERESERRLFGCFLLAKPRTSNLKPTALSRLYTSPGICRV